MVETTNDCFSREVPRYIEAFNHMESFKHNCVSKGFKSAIDKNNMMRQH